ncbi:MAG: hypothetical protein A2487_20020 [Candidatus Raymondbacteria bacterium RifOxyC12_full_50_8]|uniref:Outer membrane protein beta-barrel domain-containing protein n=1 Tax=Candidatus Raymondbacteria bacterium RIFOXYD12_FULL_49_13 TaxID=1817890 RepID=A0A1F7F3C1_UNCRA|nr:MAG: hypothetical protein A2248_10035 [Candidatus Raymondbacteria bacterium RIFOXYA2_FULL_49_16]OGJ86190.1 MAG: hypothetical protein A2350_18755 [Candidatus Raymondbacteria bacterium RifOxyB12_full_50_8]OGK01098.1 MAG: hypothetical protein A2519_20285 [Candidatus Raymondbacteria bacterium RIFOXYD12_FULL_49_13]OGK02176.1 MAG: hypothetical protein A2487_20020 [Candidatus Raymondbacteria bacterium RifOxyC12_full_50_8]OGP39308.1 MAG: hypothetical protein A2324_02415 [Candidatus Raymondbacteria b
MKTLFAILLFVVTQALYAGPDYVKYRQAFGIKASNLSGYGAFYGFKPGDRWRIQATGIYYLFDSKVKDEQRVITDYTLGLEMQKDIIQEMKHRIYIMAGGYYYHDDDAIKSSNPFHKIKDSYNTGLGIGYERFFHRVTLGLELGYKFYSDLWVEKRGIENWVPVWEKVTKIGAGLNLGFIF